MEDGQPKKNIRFTYGRNLDSSSEDSFNDSKNEDGDSESDFEYVLETVSDVAGGRGPAREEESHEGDTEEEGDEVESGKEDKYPLGKKDNFMGIKAGKDIAYQNYSADTTSKGVELAHRKSISPRIATCPARCFSSRVGSETDQDKDLALVGPLSMGLLSFDNECTKSKKLQPRIKKVKEVKSSGEKREISDIQQSYFACLKPNFPPKLQLCKKTVMEKSEA